MRLERQSLAARYLALEAPLLAADWCNPQRGSALELDAESMIGVELDSQYSFAQAVHVALSALLVALLSLTQLTQANTCLCENGNRALYRNDGSARFHLIFAGLKLTESYVRMRVFAKQVCAGLLFEIGLRQFHAATC